MTCFVIFCWNFWETPAIDQTLISKIGILNRPPVFEEIFVEEIFEEILRDFFFVLHPKFTHIQVYWEDSLKIRKLKRFERKLKKISLIASLSHEFLGQLSWTKIRRLTELFDVEKVSCVRVRIECFLGCEPTSTRRAENSRQAQNL